MALDAYALTTLAKAKEYLRADGSDDSLITNLINSASARIETYCQRQFLSRDYSEWYDGTGDQELFVENIPVTAVTRLSRDRISSLAISNSNGTWASIRSNGTNLYCRLVSGATDTTNTLAYGTYTTITTLAAAVNALGSGWSANDLGYGTYPTSDIIDCPALNCGDGQYAYLENPEDAENDWRWDEDSGRLYLPGGFSQGRQNILVEYTGGYSTVPYDVEECCHAILAYMYHGTQRDPALQSEKLGDYSWTTRSGQDDNSVIEQIMESRLSKYRRIIV